MKLDATGLDLPKRYAHTKLVCDGQLRESAAYDIFSNRHPMRWDTMINGKQVQWCTNESNHAENLREETIEPLRRTALKKIMEYVNDQA